MHRHTLHWRSCRRYAGFDKDSLCATLSKRGLNGCKMCPSGSNIFGNFKEMWKHKQLNHEGKVLLLCRFCPKKFFWLNSAILHEFKHFTTRKKSKSIPSGVHLRNETQESISKHPKRRKKSQIRCNKRTPARKTACKICGKFFPTYYHKKHMVVHSKEVKHVCEKCGMTFAWTEVYQRHQQLHNPELKKDVNKTMCVICGRSFYNRRNLKTHEQVCDGIIKQQPSSAIIIQELDDNTVIYECKFCAKHFSLKSYALRHTKCHTDPAKTKCPTCGKVFSSKRNLKRHKVTHTINNQPFQCSYCDARFTQNSSRKAHERRHTGERPYKCAFCHRGFTQSSNQRSHEKRCQTKFVEIKLNNSKQTSGDECERPC